MMTGSKVPIGWCSQCGAVYGDDLAFNFPARSVCKSCDEPVRNLQLITEAELERRLEN